MTWFTALFSLLLFCTRPGSGPGDLSGVASRIADGDSFTLLTPTQKTVRIRLNGIDAPEKKQDFYRVSKSALADMLAGKTIRVAVTGSDRYGRVLGEVYTPDNDSSVNLRLVARGLAWHFTRYSANAALAAAEKRARSQRLGLWRQPQPVAPWVFRKKKTKAAPKSPPRQIAYQTSI